MNIKLLVGFMLLTSYNLVQGQDTWLEDFEQAKTVAAESDRNIVLLFAGSDWCAPCIKLKKEVFDTEKFKSYAKDHYVLVEADFPRKKQNKLSKEQQDQNNQLAERYNQEGYFPLVVLLTKEGKKLGETGYKKVAPAEYINLLTSFEN